MPKKIIDNVSDTPITTSKDKLPLKDRTINHLRTKYNHTSIEEYKNISTIKPIMFVRNLTKKYFAKKRPAIDSLNFDVYPGEFHSFIGANGAGKTTTIKCLIGGYANWTGTILINGIKNNKEEAKKKLGYIPENARFPQGFSALSYLMWMAQLSGIKKNDARKFAIDKLKELKMWSLHKKSPNTFSSGQKKKILLAQTLVHDPDIIVMDEPVANLDPKARLDFFEQLQKLRKKKKAIFISSHVLAELDRYSDSVTVLDGGKIVYSGSKKKLLSLFPSHQYALAIQNNEIAKKYFHENHIHFTHDDIKGTLVVSFNKQEDINRFQKYVISKKQRFISFVKQEPTLDQVYDKLVVKGSVDTIKEN